MVAAHLIARFEAKLDAQNALFGAKLDALVATQNAKLDIQATQLKMLMWMIGTAVAIRGILVRLWG